MAGFVEVGVITASGSSIIGGPPKVLKYSTTLGWY
jgi:hypothetical protein